MTSSHLVAPQHGSPGQLLGQVCPIQGCATLLLSARAVQDLREELWCPRPRMPPPVNFALSTSRSAGRSGVSTPRSAGRPGRPCRLLHPWAGFRTATAPTSTALAAAGRPSPGMAGWWSLAMACWQRSRTSCTTRTRTRWTSSRGTRGDGPRRVGMLQTMTYGSRAAIPLSARGRLRLRIIARDDDNLGGRRRRRGRGDFILRH